MTQQMQSNGKKNHIQNFKRYISIVSIWIDFLDSIIWIWCARLNASATVATRNLCIEESTLNKLCNRLGNRCL